MTKSIHSSEQVVQDCLLKWAVWLKNKCGIGQVGSKASMGLSRLGQEHLWDQADLFKCIGGIGQAWATPICGIELIWSRAFVGLGRFIQRASVGLDKFDLEHLWVWGQIGQEDLWNQAFLIKSIYGSGQIQSRASMGLDSYLQ